MRCTNYKNHWFTVWRLLLIPLLAVQFLGLGMHGAAAQPADSADRILVINSQPYTTEWFNSLNERFVEEINRLQSTEFKISYEYIDGNIANDPAVAATVIEFLKHKYQWRQFRLIIAVMPSGCKFLLEHGDKFAQGDSTVICVAGGDASRKNIFPSQCWDCSKHRQCDFRHVAKC